MPGRSVTSVSGWFRIWPFLLSTVTPGKFPTCWFEPVSWLKSVVFPQFWFPARANVNTVPLGTGCSSAFWWKRPPSPRPGCSVTAFSLEIFFVFFSLLPSAFVTEDSSIKIFSASARRRVSSYPWILSSIGSPIGASFTTVTETPGITPISRKCCLSAPSPPTTVTTAVFPISRSLSVILCHFLCEYIDFDVFFRSHYSNSRWIWK